jgi:hypothetical protein
MGRALDAVSDARGILDHRGYRATDRLLSQTL